MRWWRGTGPTRSRCPWRAPWTSSATRPAAGSSTCSSSTCSWTPRSTRGPFPARERPPSSPGNANASMPPLIIAHRGDSTHVAENTLAAFAAALEVGADLVEFDVQLTKDGHVVVIHDATLDRTTTGRGRVRDLTMAEIRALSAGYPSRFAGAHRGERVPSLGEALAMLKGRARVMVEIKPESVTDDAEGGI